MSRRVLPAEVFGLRVANLALWLDAREAGIEMQVPACHAQFMVPGVPDGGLVLRVLNGRLPATDGWRSLYYPSETWELWLDDLGRYVFVAPLVSPPRRHVVVDTSFASGHVIGEFGDAVNGVPVPYPLLNIESILFVNWLAGCGDVLLHATGLDVGGAGYCFAGSGGVGKSTLAATLAAAPEVTVLGEDQVILRYLDGRFWIFGTPWHRNPAMCSPAGVPLEKLFFLERTGADAVAPCAPPDGVARLLQTAFVPYYRPEAVSAILDRLALLARSVPFYTLSYRLGADVWGLIRRAGTLRQRARCDGLGET